MNALTVLNERSRPILFNEELREFAKGNKSPATLKAYKSDMALFSGWCGERNLMALPASTDTVAAFLTAQAGLGKRASIGRRIAAIKYFHKLAGLPNPPDDGKINATLSDIGRSIGSGQVAASNTEMLRQTRNYALLLLGFAGALRPFELVALNAEDVEEVPEGLLLNIRRSIVDQYGRSRKVTIQQGPITCPVAALKVWTAAAGITTGPLFRRVFNKVEQRAGLRMSGRAVAAVMKGEARRLGMDPTQARALGCYCGDGKAPSKLGAIY